MWQGPHPIRRAKPFACTATSDLLEDVLITRSRPMARGARHKSTAKAKTYGQDIRAIHQLSFYHTCCVYTRSTNQHPKPSSGQSSRFIVPARSTPWVYCICRYCWIRWEHWFNSILKNQKYKKTNKKPLLSKTIIKKQNWHFCFIQYSTVNWAVKPGLAINPKIVLFQKIVLFVRIVLFVVLFIHCKNCFGGSILNCHGR